MKLYGLIGYPLSHSFSAEYFTAKFEKQQLSCCRYELLPLPDLSGFPVLIASHPDLAGLNVTIPHKMAVLPYLDELDPVARETGSVNTIRLLRSPGRLILHGYNTDAEGFDHSISGLLQPGDDRALILGTGGGAQAAARVLRKKGLGCIFVSRNKQDEDCLTYGLITEEIMRQCRVIVNATPAGMLPHIRSFPPLPYEHISKDHLLFDMVYNPGETIFLKKGKEKGARVKNGLEMLVVQAERSWQIWSGDQQAK